MPEPEVAKVVTPKEQALIILNNLKKKTIKGTMGQRQTLIYNFNNLEKIIKEDLEEIQ